MIDFATLSIRERREADIPLSADDQALADEIAERLHETDPMPRKLIQSLIFHCGADAVRACLEETVEIEGGEGLPTKNGKRRRTPGGVFFYLMQQRTGHDIHKLTFDTYKNPSGPKQPRKPKAQTNQQPKSDFDWSRRLKLVPPLIAQPGAASTVKVTLIGRPGATKVSNNTVMTTVEHVVKTASLPKGVPTPPRTPTLYTVYIGLKQWNRVKEALENDPEDAMIVEGVSAYDPELSAMAVFATNVTTKALETAKRGAKAEAAEEAPAPVSPPAQAEPEPELDIPNTLSPEAQAQLRGLYDAAAQFRQKLTALEARPENQRMGYEMTRKLLQNTEAQIKNLLKQKR